VGRSRADRARLRRCGPPSAADQHGTGPTPGWSQADRSSCSSSGGEGSSSKQQQRAGAEWRVSPHAVSPGGAGLTLCRTRPGLTDPSRMERNTLQICTEPDLQCWAGPERTDLASKMLNANPCPPQRTGVATAEDKTGPQTLC
jgi:hypothetical protein